MNEAGVNPAQAMSQHGWRTWPRPFGLTVSALIVCATALIAYALRGVLPASSFPLLFLIAVLVASVRYGFWTGIATSLLAFVSYDFFFVEPLYTLRIAHVEDALVLVVLFVAAATTGFLAGRMREQADAAHARAVMLERLALFTADLATAADTNTIRQVLVRHLAAINSGSAVYFASGGQGLVVTDAQPPGVALDVHDLHAADRAFRRGSEEQRTAPGWDGSDFTFHAIGDGVIGYRGTMFASHADIGEQFCQTILRQAKLAFERLRFAREAEEAQSEAERASLRAALLSSLSHDLKTPLATILGGVSSLRQLSETLGAEARADLLQAVEEEAERLSRYVVNLLHMTKLKAGIDLRRDWIDVVDVIGGAIGRARRSLPDRAIEFESEASLPLIRGDAVLLEQAIFNVIDNAVRFSSGPRPVSVQLARDQNDEMSLHVRISDSGAGISKKDLPLVFEPFYRGEKVAGTNAVAGTGLGLAITRDIVTAMSGAIAAESPLADNGGTAVHIRLPVPTDDRPAADKFANERAAGHVPQDNLTKAR